MFYKVEKEIEYVKNAVCITYETGERIIIKGDVGPKFKKDIDACQNSLEVDELVSKSFPEHKIYHVTKDGLVQTETKVLDDSPSFINFEPKIVSPGRLKTLFQNYICNDLDAAPAGYVEEALALAGATEEEIKELCADCFRNRPSKKKRKR